MVQSGSSLSECGTVLFYVVTPATRAHATLLLDSRVLLHMSSKIVRSCESLGRIPAGLNRTVLKLLL